VAHQIGDMLDYSELEMGKTVVTERDYSISSILDDMVTELKIYKETGTELVIDVDPSLPSVMISDPDKLEKILFHIIFNALKYTERGGVYVRISHMPREYGVNLNIDVTDTGIGMDEEEVEKIYDRFYKADTGRKGDQSGLGLGMSIVEGFVNALEGFVIVNSIPGEGTRVHVSIPQKVADASKCMSVENADQLEVGLYLQFDRFPDPQVREFYNEMMRNMAQGLELKVYRVDNEKDLRMLIKTHALTHLFVGELQYASDPVYMEELARTLKLVIVCDSGYEIAGRTGAILLRKPFYCFPVMSILQNEPEEDIQAEDIKTETGPEFTGEAAAEEKENEGFAILRRAGIDPAKGMDWCLNDTEVYTAVLLEFASDVREKQKELDSFFEAADWGNFMIRVHAVKSSANTIGASGLSESAKKLEKAARENDSRYIGSEYPDFMQEYLETLEAINRAYGADKSCPSAAPDEDTPAKGASG
ncbi:MAG: Hpt domain-containing protein, partial [Lachnospiraceae bacterium]|nr:Hpt domain-containing protein [Lachnospiraceae bacterium]